MTDNYEPNRRRYIGFSRKLDRFGRTQNSAPRIVHATGIDDAKRQFGKPAKKGEQIRIYREEILEVNLAAVVKFIGD